MRVLFAGTPAIALPTLVALDAAGHDIVAVITQPDAPQRRSKQPQPSPVKVEALSRSIPVLTPTRASDADVIEQVRAMDIDVAAVVAYGQILTRPLLDATAHGWVNLHFSLLPAWRGAAPVQRAIMAGDELTGASTFVLEEGLDAGPVLGMLTEPIAATDTAGQLLERLAARGAQLMVDSVEGLVAGPLAPQPQSTDGISYAHKIAKHDARIVWERPAHVVDRMIRGCTPAPGAWTTLPDASLARLGPVTLVTQAPTLSPGAVRVSDGQVWVGTGTTAVQLSTITPAGKKEMDATAWARGARLHDAYVVGEA